jgi:hypothetical protein
MASKKKVPALSPAEFAVLVAHRINSAEVKTASPSRAQNRIQVRIAWTDPDGKPGLGYLSMFTTSAERLGKGSTGPLLKNFIDDVFRTEIWAKTLIKDAYGSHWTDAQDELHSELDKLGEYVSSAKIHTLQKQAIDAIRKCAAAGVHVEARKTRNRKRAEDYLGRALLWAMNNGLKDDEIREIIHTAMVKHTMES